MDYKIDTITVIDAFKEDCECPLCKIKADMDAAYVSSCLGAGAMVPERRVEVNRCGFCTAHLKQLYDAQTRLPLALQLQAEALSVFNEAFEFTVLLVKGEYGLLVAAQIFLCVTADHTGSLAACQGGL